MGKRVGIPEGWTGLRKTGLWGCLVGEGIWARGKRLEIELDVPLDFRSVMLSVAGRATSRLRVDPSQFNGCVGLSRGSLEDADR